jgi:[ribosomal protein S18]-alanine N-acetyltransferase
MDAEERGGPQLAETWASDRARPLGILGDSQALSYFVEDMQLRHVPAVSAIERESFPSSWPASAYRRELERNNMAHYMVAKRSSRAGEPKRDRRFPVTGVDGGDHGASLLARLRRLIKGEARTFSAEEAGELEIIVGYTGMWIMVDEAHVTTIAVDPPYRGEGIGELLLLGLLEEAYSLQAEVCTLECRVTNLVAQRLYRKYTFQDAGIRKRYYSDDGEDALIMTTQRLDSDLFQDRFQRNRERLIERLGSVEQVES